MSTDKAEEARKGLLDTVAGKAKEAAGALTGKDELVEEGQLQQAGARTRKEAAGQDAIADAERDVATAELQDSTRDAAADKRDVHAEGQRSEQAARQDAATQEAAADRAALDQEATDRDRAESAADAEVVSGQAQAAQLAADADDTERRAEATRDQLVREAEEADRRAAQLRAETKD